METHTDKLTERQRRILDFLLFVDRLKMIERWGLVGDGSRRETDAEHTWHMALYAVLLHREIALECDLAHALKLVLIHDLVEIHAGDAPAYDAVAQAGQAERERAAADRLYAMLPADIGEDLKAMWHEFEAAETPEARFATAADFADRALAVDRSNPDALSLRGVCLLHLSRFDEAIKAMEAAMGNAPGHAHIASLTGYVHRYAGDAAGPRPRERRQLSPGARLLFLTPHKETKGRTQ